jgi:hypothetical protein
MTKLKLIRSTGIRAYRWLWVAKLKARELANDHRKWYWVMHEPGCNIVLSFENVEKLNKLTGKKLKAKDLNRMACYIGMPR